MKKGKYRNKIVSSLTGLFFLWVGIFLLAGCGDNAFEGIADDSSDEAMIEEARIALDEGDYAAARDILEGMDQDDSLVAQYLSNAYAGLAGLDTFTLLEVIDSFTANNTGDIDMVGKVLGDENGKLTSNDVTTKLGNLTKAIETLNVIPKNDLSDDHKIQLGLLSVNRVALTIADIVMADTNQTEITLTENGIKQLYPSGSQPDFSQVDTSTISQDILNVANSIGPILNITGTTIQGNDLASNFDEFRNDVDGNNDKWIDYAEIENYINNCIIANTC